MNRLVSKKELISANNEAMRHFFDDYKPITGDVRKCIADPDYIYSAEFAMKHSNFVDNGDGTISPRQPKPFESNNG